MLLSQRYADSKRIKIRISSHTPLVGKGLFAKPTIYYFQMSRTLCGEHDDEDVQHILIGCNHFKRLQKLHKEELLKQVQKVYVEVPKVK